MDVIRTLTTRDGAAVAYRLCREDGRHPLITLLHGAASNMTRWSEFVERTTLKASHDILCPDLRGHAESITRRRIGLEVWTADLAALLEAEGYPRAVLAGHCLGANIAIQFAVRYPQKTEALVLLEPVFPEALTGVLGRLRDLVPLLRLTVGITRGLNRLGLHRRRFERLDLRTLDAETRAILAGGGTARALLRRHASPWADLKTMPTASYLQDLIELGRPLPPLSRIEVPVLALVSSSDTFGDTATRQRLLGAIRRCRIEVVECEHWMLTEKPDHVREAMEQWCAGLR